MALVDQKNEPTNFVDQTELVSKWQSDEDVQWWDDFDDTPGVEVWTDLRPAGARRGKPKVPGAESITQADIEGQATSAREGAPGAVKEPEVRGDWLSIAKSQIGAPYVWADANPEGMVGGGGSGFDCSGFTAWLYSSAFGIALPHLSEGQRTSTQKVSRKNLRPGDLIFYHYSDRNGPGTADHVEIYLGGGKAIGTPSGDQGVGVQDVDWDAFMQGGRVEGADTSFEPPKETEQHRRGRESAGTEWQNNLNMIPASMGAKPNLADVQVGLLMDSREEVGRRDGRNDRVPTTLGPGSESIQKVKRQVYRGFMDAGRPDLAKMVGTKDFDTWITAESQWNPYSVSRFFPGHGRNGGLFQFAFLDRDWVLSDVSHSDGAWSYSSTPYQQARSVVQYFSLTPADIKRYAEQIRTGTYSGWG